MREGEAKAKVVNAALHSMKEAQAKWEGRVAEKGAYLIYS